MRDYEQSKDIYEHDHTDITRRGNAIIHKNKQNPFYTKYRPGTIGSLEKDEVYDENEEIKNMGLSKYLKLLSEDKIKDTNIDSKDIDILKKLAKSYRERIHYEEDKEGDWDRYEEENMNKIFNKR